MTAYAELAATTNYSFLRGASHPADMVCQALDLGHTGIGIADRNSVAGVVRAYSALKDAREAWRKAGETRPLPFTLVVGARLVFCDGTPDILAYPENRAGWGRLCRLLTLGKRRAAKGACDISLDDLIAHARDLLLIVMPGQMRGAALEPLLRRLETHAPGAVWLAARMAYEGQDRRRLCSLAEIARAAGVPLIATNDALYHDRAQRPLQDVVTCIREGVSLDAAGYRLKANAERHLKEPAEMARLFADAPGAIAETQALLSRIGFSLDQLSYNYPDEPVPPGRTAQEWLEELTWRHAAFRYPKGVPQKVDAVLRDELRLIEELNYAPYFLTIHDIVRVAQDKGILCQGRGSAANSAVCFVLGITVVDPADHDLLFARFISSERKEPPDIDVDFEHERREEIIQHIYQRYGRHRAGIAATVISYRPRSAMREVGKVFGLTEDVTNRLSGTVWGGYNRDISDRYIRQAGLDPENPTIRRTLDMAQRLLGFPRHLSQHVGGFVLTQDRLDAIVPIGNAAMEDRTFIEWDKDDISALSLMKVDVLALGMLTCIRKCLDLMRAHCDIDYALADVPREDPTVYDMLCRGDSIGVFQVESRAQINMLPRLRPREFYDLVIQVAIVRPGPIQGDMVHPYLRRRNNEEEVSFPSPAPEHGPPDELEQVLKKTLGVPLFQEHAMKIAIVAARFTPDEANALRRAMATFRRVGTIDTFSRKMVEGMVKRGYDRDFAARCFEQIKGFGEYGFPESHAASFAKLVYISSWIKCHHPAVFACGLLNAQPMGFYAPAQIVRDAREHGVPVLATDINHSFWDNTLERDGDGVLALRLGFRQIDGFRQDWARALEAKRGAGLGSVEALWRHATIPKDGLKRLANADALRSIGLDRRNALWAVRRLPDDEPLPLFEAARARELAEERPADLPQMGLGEHVVADYQTTRLSLKAHPMALLRGVFSNEGILTSEEMARQRDGAWVQVAGVVLIRQRPGKGNAIFMTLEDETGVVNAVLWARRFESFRREVMAAKLALVRGHVQRSKEGVIHLMATSIDDRTRELDRLSDSHKANIMLSRADEFTNPQYPRGYQRKEDLVPSRAQHPRDARIIPKSRDFH
ncbi:error-prone DNA polymerase [Tepidamorphus sp. 3E244]|uniref:error-prone DNA polymerase n=1 Tax=Tepidamorphus sp. 3E244 TaxID=3385498 RepID=UPI0038FC2FD7